MTASKLQLDELKVLDSKRIARDYNFELCIIWERKVRSKISEVLR